MILSGCFVHRKGPRAFVCFGEKAFDSGLQGDKGVEHAALQPPLREFGKEALNLF